MASSSHITFKAQEMRPFCNHGAKMQLAEYLATVYLKSGIQSKVQMYKPTNQTYNTSRYFNSKVDPSIGYCSNLRNCIIKMTGLVSLNHGWKPPSETWRSANKLAAHWGSHPLRENGIPCGLLILPEFPNLPDKKPRAEKPAPSKGCQWNGPIRGMFLKPCKSWDFN